MRSLKTFLLLGTWLGNNIAGAGIATQVDNYIDQYNEYAAEYAIDGDYASSSITLSGGDEAWWKLTFPSTILVQKIVIYPRSCCKYRMFGVTGMLYKPSTVLLILYFLTCYM